MNTTGFLRGYMAKNMSVEKFIKVATEAIAKEFGEEANVNNIAQDRYEILFKVYRAVINNNKIAELKSKSPYAVDKFLLTKFRNQGFVFDEKRSQYIRYCFGHFEV